MTNTPREKCCECNYLKGPALEGCFCKCHTPSPKECKCACMWCEKSDCKMCGLDCSYVHDTPSPKGEEWVEQFDNVLHTDEIYFDEDLQNDGFFPSKEKILAFIRELLSEEKKKSYEEGHNTAFDICKREKRDIQEAAVASYKAEIEKKIEGMMRSSDYVGKAPGDDAVGSEHRAFGFNAALSELKSKL